MPHVSSEGESGKKAISRWTKLLRLRLKIFISTNAWKFVI